MRVFTEVMKRLLGNANKTTLGYIKLHRSSKTFSCKAFYPQHIHFFTQNIKFNNIFSIFFVILSAACKKKEEDAKSPPSSNNNNSHVKKPRLVFTDIQRRTLHAIFKETKRPSKEMQMTIAQQLGLELSTVSNFFMNARRRSIDKWQDENGNPQTHLGGNPCSPSSMSPNTPTSITPKQEYKA